MARAGARLRWVVAMLATALVYGAASNIKAQSTDASALAHAADQFAIETWRTDNGLPQNTGSAVIQTRRGYIWVATYGGIAEFDGWRFKVYDSSNTKGLANSRVTSLFEDSRGTIWIGHDTGEISVCSNGVFRVVSVVIPDWPRNPVKEFVEDENSSLWAVNQRGEALHLADSRLVLPTGYMAENPFVNPRTVSLGQGITYVLRNGSAARLGSSGYTPVSFADPAERPYYSGMTAARNGELWVLGEGRLRKWDGTKWSADYGGFPVANASVTTMLETSSGLVVVGTLQNGLLVLQPGSGWVQLNRADGLPQDWVCSVAEDREQNLWVGTGGGLALLRERKVRMLNPPDQWAGRPVLSTLQASDGSLWATTEGAGIYRRRDQNWVHYEVFNPFVWSIIEDSQKRIWAGTWGGGLFLLKGNEFVVQTNLIPNANPITALKEWPVGTLWIGTGRGLLRLREGRLEDFASLGGAAAGDVRALETGQPGELWIGTQGSGLGHWENGQIRTMTTANGLNGNFILSLYAETNGTLWIGTLDQGLGRYRGGQFNALTTADGLPANTVYHIEDDLLGNLWFNSPVGIYRISKSDLNRSANHESKSMTILTYGKAEGMTTLTGTGGFTPSGFRAPDGKLWFSTARGIAVISPGEAHPNPVPPPVWIEEIFLNGELRPAMAQARSAPTGGARGRTATELIRTLVIQPGRHQLDITFTALSYTAPERVRFRYRLEGMDNQWTESGARRQVTYSFLPPGDYTFRVIACNSDGLWNLEGDALAIQVLPHFWQELWFKTMLTLVACGVVGLGVYGISRRRHRQKLERIARERALETERARIAQDIHDDLGASLTRIGLLSESAAGDLEDPTRAAASLDQITSTTRELTRSMDEIVWAVNPRHDTIESLINYISRFAQDFLSTAQIRCRLAMPLQLPDVFVRSEVRHNLFLACKEALNNVVKHAAAREVRLGLELVRGGLKLSISDDGQGFDLGNRTAKVAGARRGRGNGLANMEQRLRQIGGSSQMQSAPGKGTTAEFFVPLPGHLMDS